MHTLSNSLETLSCVLFYSIEKSTWRIRKRRAWQRVSNPVYSLTSTPCEVCVCVNVGLTACSLALPFPGVPPPAPQPLVSLNSIEACEQCCLVLSFGPVPPALVLFPVALVLFLNGFSGLSLVFCTTRVFCFACRFVACPFILLAIHCHR